MFRRRALALAILVSAVAVSLAAAEKASPLASIDFSRDIRPILSENCFACHGPDEKQRKAKLRLDIREGAVKEDDDGAAAIIPGDTARSKLVQRITTTDEDDVMPPRKTGKKLTAAQIDLLTRWVGEGGEYKVHWSFLKPERPNPPAVQNTQWPRNDIDRFVLARLEKEGLTPAREADRTTLIRRVTLDLTGLPPTPQEVEAFVADPSAEAYEKLVDRLLQSPRYGEQMTRYWLDAARYADSHGYHIDAERSVWKYREWLVEAFNTNKPFDQFTLEQLAGDLLPEPTTDQKIASGYVRCNMSTGEGGAIVEEYQAKYTFDRVETTSTIWMGLTLTCARCHTHKYDPISQKEYYGLYALFNNLNESVMDGNKPNPDPFVRVPTPQQAERQEWLKRQVAEGQRKIEAPMPELDGALREWQVRWHEKLTQGIEPLAFGSARSTATNGVEFKLLEDRSIVVTGTNPPSDVQELSFRLPAGMIAALRLETLPHASLPKQGAARADDGRFRLAEIEAEVLPPGLESNPVKLKFARAAADDEETKFEIGKAIDGKKDTGWGVAAGAVTQAHTGLFVLAKPARVARDAELRVRLSYEASPSKRALGRFRLSAISSGPLAESLHPPSFTTWQVLGPLKSDEAGPAFAAEDEPEKAIDLQKTYPGVREPVKWTAQPEFEDGKSHLLVQDLHGIHGVRYLYRSIIVPEERRAELSFRADGVFKAWLNGAAIFARDHEEKPGEGPAKAVVQLRPGTNTLLVKIVTVQGASYFTFQKEWLDVGSVAPEIAAALATTSKPLGGQAATIRNYYRRLASPEFKALFDEVEKYRDEEAAIEKTVPLTLVAKETDQPRETVMLLRGEYDKKGEKVAPGLPAVLPPWPKDAPTNRLGLAKWLVDPSHPLTARVTVNRLWQQFFGTGFVKTADDFGVQGEYPSHPELLDWLATNFRQDAWDIKHLLRLIVTSATYRQSATVPAEVRARDPENRLLARGPRLRLDGEMVRDLALYVSGLLVEKIGGKSVKPYEPAGLWEAVSFNNSQKYVQDLGEGNYRRSLYTYWKRQSPPPNMLIFDAPTREYCVVRRPRTNTPLQALALLNDPQFVEASRAFAQRILLEGGPNTEQRLKWAFQMVCAREPSAEELAVLRGVYDQERAEFKKNNEAVEKFHAVGSFKPREGLDRSELAAWATIASLLLNLDEAITKG